MKNLAIIIPSLSGGGAERIAGLLSKKLSSIYNVYLFVVDTHNSTYDFGGTIVNLSINGKEYVEYYIAEYKRKYKIDCAISFLEGMNFSNIRTRGNECVIISERSARPSIGPLTRNEVEGIKRLYNYADQIVAVSKGAKYNLIENFGVDENIITTIYNFIDVDNIYEKMNERIDSDILSFVGDSKIVLNVGRLHEVKNQKKILIQFEKLLHENESVKLLILGTGRMKSRLESLIKVLGIEKYVRIIPYVKNPFPYYRLATLFVLASKHEGLPNVLLEAMACGVPIAAVDCLSGPRELLKDNSNYKENIAGYEVCSRGILVEQTDTDETGETEYLKEAMQLLLHDDDIRKRIAENGKRYMSEYSNDRILDEWINVIENTQDRKPAPPKDPDAELEKSKKIIIYGAGKVGLTLVLPYLEKEDEYDLLCFAVSDKTENNTEVFGLPVFGIEELVEYREDAVVLMGVSHQYQKEVADMLDKHGFKNVVYPSYKHENYRYYAELEEGEYKAALARWYRIRTGMKLDWNNLRTYNEKLQWLKLYDQTENKRILSDKFRVRDFVRKKIGERHLVPLLGCWDSFDEIEFEKLPSEFVLKCNHGRGWNLVVHNKEELDLYELKEQFDSWMMLDYAFCSGLELNYREIKPKIIAEQMLHSSKGKELKNYKVFVFDGYAKIIQVDIDTNTYHRRNLYTRDWEYLPYGIGYSTDGDTEIKKPDCLDELISFAEILGSGFRHILVKFYVIGNNIYFGEVTFSHESGAEKFISQDFALEMGSWINIPEQK